MKLRNLFLVVIVAAFFSLAANVRADGTNTAASAWQTLTNFTPLPPPVEWQTNPPTQEQLGKFDDERAAQTGALADKAREFYLLFPQDTNAFPARVMELQALQAAIHLGATNRLADLVSREQEVLANTNAPEELRYELRLDEIGRDLKASSASEADMNTALEKAGRALVKEFPSGPAGYEILIEQSEMADFTKMQEFGELMANSGGPAEFTDIGKGLLRRIDAVGKPLPIEFTTADGRAVNLATLSNKVVFVDFWATWCPHCVEAVPEIKKLYEQYHTNGFEVVGINFDDTTNTAQRFIKEQGLDWPQYFGGRDNKFGREYALNALPSGWLVDRKGIVRDIHAPQNLSAKIAKLMGEKD